MIIEYKNIVKRPPLPFLGNKRNALKKLYEYFKNIDLDEEVVIIDLFGGSGLLSNLFKQMYPKNRVIYNDFDDYHIRIEQMDNTINILNEILSELKTEGELKKQQALNDKQTIIFKNKIKKLKNRKDIDLITIGRNFTFQGVKCDKLEEQKSFYLQRINTPEKNEEYLKGVEIVKKDFMELINEYKDKKVLFIADPPYISTLQNQYKGKAHFIENLMLLKYIGNNFIYFSSYSSGTYDIIKYINTISKDESVFNIPKIRYKYFFEFASAVKHTEFCLINLENVQIKKGVLPLIFLYSFAIFNHRPNHRPKTNKK